jgi:hypothetical protein
VIDLKQNLPAAVIYEEILPRLVTELVDPVVPYVRGSPYGGEGWDTYDRNQGDVVSVAPSGKCVHITVFIA